MTWLRGFLKELWGLFVEDASYAIAILAWVGIVYALAEWKIIPPAWQGFLLFAGLALILLENVLRSEKRIKSAKAAASGAKQAEELT